MKNSNFSLPSAITEQFVPTTSVVVALSGGADSVCLLHLLSVYAKQIGFNLSAVHVNHHLRGDESERDAEFCKQICMSMAIPLTLLDVFVNEEKQAGESVELAARRLRYSAFETVSADFIATAHNADDALETFLLNFSRGSGLRGLCGIPERRGRYIRPILHITKREIMEYCEANGLQYVFDSSNASDLYLRNQLRHHVLPKLNEIFPSLHSVSTRNFELLRSDLSFLEHQAEVLYQTVKKDKGLSISALTDAHEALATRVLASYCENITGRLPDFKHSREMLSLCKQKQGSIGLFGGYFAEVHKELLVIRKIENCEFRVKTKQISYEKEKFCRNVNNLFFKNAIDCDKIVGKLSIRSRLSGDMMHPFGRGVGKEIRRLQAENDIPKELRDMAPIASDDNGPIWGYEIGIDERVAIDENTKKVLVFEVYQTKNRGQ